MTLVRMHFDGWISSPEAARRKLELATGTELELDLLDDAVLLRPVAARRGSGTVNLSAEDREGWNAAGATRQPRHR
jgi:hypothetical protein